MDAPLCYAGGDPYRPVGALSRPVIRLRGASVSWRRLWEIVQAELCRQGYSRGTRLLYRQVLRRFSRYAFARCPGEATEGMVRSYLHALTRQGCSAAWVSANISVLRTVLDKIGGMGICTRLVTPKRPRRLPELLGTEEVGSMVAAVPTLRDRLILGLLYGCGLRVGELCRLRWEDLDMDERVLRVRGDGRRVDLPHALVGTLARGVEVCAAGDFVFPGAKEGSHLSGRMVERVVRGAAEAAGIGKPVCCMTLRHAYAIQRLRDGDPVREVQESLGHRRVRTTMRYLRCMIADGVRSPLEDLGEAPDALPEQAYVLPSPEDLPFAGVGDSSAGFRFLIKTHLCGRFMGLRRFLRRARGSP